MMMVQLSLEDPGLGYQWHAGSARVGMPVAVRQLYYSCQCVSCILRCAVGVWSAIRAAQAGASVVLLEQFQPGHERGSSHGPPPPSPSVGPDDPAPRHGAD